MARRVLITGATRGLGLGMEGILLTVAMPWPSPAAALLKRMPTKNSKTCNPCSRHVPDFDEGMDLAVHANGWHR